MLATGLAIILAALYAHTSRFTYQFTISYQEANPEIRSGKRSVPCVGKVLQYNNIYDYSCLNVLQMTACIHMMRRGLMGRGDSDPISQFGSLLRAYRREAELTQRELAAKAGLSVAALRD